jgi:hypothetical protein
MEEIRDNRRQYIERPYPSDIIGTIEVFDIRSSRIYKRKECN